MKKDIEFYEALLKVLYKWIDNIKTEKNYLLTESQIKGLAKHQANKVVCALLEDNIVQKDWDPVHKTYYRYLRRPVSRDYRLDAEKELKELIRKEDERVKALQEKISNIKYARKGYIVSIIAIVLSGLSILLNLIILIMSYIRA